MRCFFEEMDRCKDASAFNDILIDGANFWCNRIQDAINGSRRIDLPLIIYALEFVAQSPRRDAICDKEADGLIRALHNSLDEKASVIDLSKIAEVKNYEDP